MGRKQKINPDCRRGSMPCPGTRGVTRGSGGWANAHPRICRCRGKGWVLCTTCSGAGCR